MFKLIKLFIYLIIAVVLFAMNPDREAHEKAIKESTAKDNAIAAMLGAGWLKSKSVTYKDFYLFSITYYDDVFVSAGAAGKVWVGNIDTSKLKDIKEKVEKQVDKLNK